MGIGGERGQGGAGGGGGGSGGGGGALPGGICSSALTGSGKRWRNCGSSSACGMGRTRAHGMEDTVFIQIDR